MTTNAHTFDQVASEAAKIATYGGASGAAVGGWLLSSEGMALIGVLLAAAGFATNAWLGWRRDRREQREHEARMSALGADDDA